MAGSRRAIRTGVSGFRLDVGELELLAHDFGEFLERDIHFEQVATRRIAGSARLVSFYRAHRLAYFTLTLSYSTQFARFVAKAGDIDLANGNTYYVLALAAQKLTGPHVLPQLFLDYPANDLSEASKVSIDALYHVCSLRVLRIPSREDARDEVEHVGRTLIVVSEVANQALFNHVDLCLRVLVHNV